jgi:hypothetical protein
MKCYMQTTILHIEVRPKAKSQKPNAKSQVGMQMGDFSSKMQQIAREAAPICPRLLKKN